MAKAAEDDPSAQQAGIDTNGNTAQQDEDSSRMSFKIPNIGPQVFIFFFFLKNLSYIIFLFKGDPVSSKFYVETANEP